MEDIEEQIRKLEDALHSDAEEDGDEGQEEEEGEGEAEGGEHKQDGATEEEDGDGGDQADQRVIAGRGNTVRGELRARVRRQIRRNSISRGINKPADTGGNDFQRRLILNITLLGAAALGLGAALGAL